MLADQAATEQTVGLFEPMPHRYIFLPGRDTRIIAVCRGRTLAVGRTVYSVLDSRGEIIGLRVPHYILEPVIAEDMRLAELRDHVGALFPGMPAQRRDAFLEWFDSSEAGRCSGDERDIVMRAVFAFVRRFEKGGLVRAARGWRKTCRSQGVEEIVKGWGYRGVQTKRKYRRNRKVDRSLSVRTASAAVSGCCEHGPEVDASLDPRAGIRGETPEVERQQRQQEIVREWVMGGHGLQDTPVPASSAGDEDGDTAHSLPPLSITRLSLSDATMNE